MFRIQRVQGDSFSAADAKKLAEQEEDKRRQKFYKAVQNVMKVLAKAKQPGLKFYVRHLSDEDLEWVVDKLRASNYIVRPKDVEGFMSVFWDDSLLTFNPTPIPASAPPPSNTQSDGTIRYPGLSP